VTTIVTVALRNDRAAARQAKLAMHAPPPRAKLTMHAPPRAQLGSRPKHTVFSFMQLDLAMRNDGHALGRERARWTFPIDAIAMDVGTEHLREVANVPPLWLVKGGPPPARAASATVAAELAATFPFLEALQLCPSVQLAGGSVCRAILQVLRRQSNEKYRTVDADVFFGNLGVGEATVALRARVESLRAWCIAARRGYSVFRGRFTTRFMIHAGGAVDGPLDGRTGTSRAWSRHTRFEVQFVHRLFHSEADITIGFDIGPAQVAFDGRTVRLTPLACLAYAGRFMIVDTAHESSSFVTRICKYANRGFGVIFPFGAWRDTVEIEGLPGLCTFWNRYGPGPIRGVMLGCTATRVTQGRHTDRDYDDEYEDLLPRSFALSRACAIEHAVALGSAGAVGAYTTSAKEIEDVAQCIFDPRRRTRGGDTPFPAAMYALLPVWPPAARAAFAVAIIAPTEEERLRLLSDVRRDAAVQFREQLTERYREFDVNAVIPRVQWNNLDVSTSFAAWSHVALNIYCWRSW
jgi:hypothetical protein